MFIELEMRCLPWHAAMAAVEGKDETVTTE
jgi:hypothetical protein